MSTKISFLLMVIAALALTVLSLTDNSVSVGELVIAFAVYGFVSRIFGAISWYSVGAEAMLYLFVIPTIIGFDKELSAYVLIAYVVGSWIGVYVRRSKPSRFISNLVYRVEVILGVK